MEQLQSHIWLTASSYMAKYLRISSYIRSPSSYMTLQLLHSEFPYIWGIWFSFYQCTVPGTHTWRDLTCCPQGCRASLTNSCSSLASPGPVPRVLIANIFKHLFLYGKISFWLKKTNNSVSFKFDCWLKISFSTHTHSVSLTIMG